MKRRILTLGTLAVCVCAARAQEAALYTLSDCETRALELSSYALNARRDALIAEESIRQVRAQVFPQLDTKAEYTRLDDVSSFDYGAGAVDMGRVDNYAVAFEAGQLLYAGGSVDAALKAARHYRNRATAGVTGTLQRIARDVRLAFYDVLLAEEYVDVQQAAVEQLESLARDAESRRKAETLSEFESLSVQVRLANERPLLIDARKRLEWARNRLRKLAWLDEGAYTLDGALDFKPVDVDPARALEVAFRERPDAEGLRQQIKLWEADVRAEQGRYLPRLSARAAYKGNNPPAGEARDEWAWGWEAGLALNWNWLDGGLRRSRVREKALEREKTLTDLDERYRQIELDVRDAVLELRRSAETVLAGERNADLAARGLAIARTRFDAGLATYLDVTEANLALRRARLTHSTALRDHLAARAQLQFACGLDDERFPGEIQDERARP